MELMTCTSDKHPDTAVSWSDGDGVNHRSCPLCLAMAAGERQSRQIKDARATVGELEKLVASEVAAGALALLDDQPEESYVWKLLNAFASGETQKQFARVEPIAVLGEAYQGFAVARARRQALLEKLVIKRQANESEPKEEKRANYNRTGRRKNR